MHAFHKITTTNYEADHLPQKNSPTSVIVEVLQFDVKPNLLPVLLRVEDLQLRPGEDGMQGSEVDVPVRLEGL